jgi:hypothetical protein
MKIKYNEGEIEIKYLTKITKKQTNNCKKTFQTGKVLILSVIE